jgi:hypothetical protein
MNLIRRVMWAAVLILQFLFVLAVTFRPGSAHVVAPVLILVLGHLLWGDRSNNP